MKRKTNYITVNQTLDLDLSHEHRQKWLKLTNLRYFGAEEIPLNVPRSEISQDHRDVHWHVFAGRRIKVKIRLYDNGDLEVLPEKFFSKAQIPLIPNNKKSKKIT